VVQAVVAQPFAELSLPAWQGLPQTEQEPLQAVGAAHDEPLPPQPRPPAQAAEAIRPTARIAAKRRRER
jgi:hypothetical protein